MSIFTRIRSLTLTTLTAMIVVAPGCDDGADYEALGVTVEDLEAMSADELDALEADALDFSLERLVTHPKGPQERPEGMKALVRPLVPTHSAQPEGREALTARPRPTHTGEVPAPAADAFAADIDETGGCDTHGEDVEFVDA